MTSVDKYSFNSASFSFSFTTSSGDKIDLKMFDSLEMNSETSSNAFATKQEFTLKHQYGYEFSYKGDGLSEQDLKEIKEALNRVKPMLEKFLKEKNSNEKTITNFTHQIKSFLPSFKNENSKNALKSMTLDSFDEVLKSIKAQMSELERAKQLFDKLFDESNKLEFFA
ncbi:MAG: ATP/GTP-binding protein [Epsilonproteobacteria bacterium]|nr:ATP/GTP-binding protein [Campylobacterota bacterium]